MVAEKSRLKIFNPKHLSSRDKSIHDLKKTIPKIKIKPSLDLFFY
jgi:hypothetical protein